MCFSFWGTSFPKPSIPGLRPWTPLGDSPRPLRLCSSKISLKNYLAHGSARLAYEVVSWESNHEGLYDILVSIASLGSGHLG